MALKVRVPDGETDSWEGCTPVEVPMSTGEANEYLWVSERYYKRVSEVIE